MLLEHKIYQIHFKFVNLSDKSNHIYIKQKTLKFKNLPVDPWTAKAKQMTQSSTSWRTAGIPTSIRYNNKSENLLPNLLNDDEQIKNTNTIIKKKRIN